MTDAVATDGKMIVTACIDDCSAGAELAGCLQLVGLVQVVKVVNSAD